MTEEGATPVSPYAVLGVASDASDSEVRSAYRALARVLHPDASAAPVDAQARMAAVNEAYATLADPGLRADYDRSLHGVRAVSGGTAGRGRGTGAGVADEDFGDEDRDKGQDEDRDPFDGDDGSGVSSSPLSAAAAVCAALGGISLGLGFALFSGGLALFGTLLLVLSGALTALRFRQAMRSGRTVSRH